ncbi:EAL domain-containing protein [Alicyclobacillus tolerans]|uniref:putative bifunctional diguanylate cyclase/phosphodiesterase n=1 Tax=Alicyclobacillus tolerans TaxID=90970 RepID=UPI001F30C3DF|nr:EAL domain-containing protein [Alicyclobacillus tolerans]MCF8564856.1 EAL domain-containing protein [Alicyclobacillus tolerans]
MKTFFAPAISLMNRLSYKARFLFVGLLSTFPVLGGLIVIQQIQHRIVIVALLCIETYFLVGLYFSIQNAVMLLRQTFREIAVGDFDELQNIDLEFKRLKDSYYQIITEKDQIGYNFKNAQAQLMYLAGHDALTGLANRRLFHEYLSNSIDDRRLNGGTLGLIFVDIDQFKLINDTLGHMVGDLVLKDVGIRLQACRDSEDVVARIGGDEFTILLRSAKNQEEIKVFADKMLRSFRKSFMVNENPMFLTPSLGISVYPDDAENGDELFKHADVAMYHAKELGGNRYIFYSPEMNEETQRRLELTRMLREALEREEFRVYYQPQMNIRTNSVMQVEALVRWQHPTRGIVSPGEFIPVAEETGLMMPLTRWVLQTACSQVKKWHAQGLSNLGVAVNVSPQLFEHREGLVQMVSQVLQETQLEPDYLELEITESISMYSIRDVIEILGQLDALGIRIAIDDFGTGYSSLGYLKHFPIDSLKIDRSFIDGILENPSDRAIVESIIGIANGLKLSIIAEGVENSTQLQILEHVGCNIIQGYLFSRPIPAEEFHAWWLNYKKTTDLT